MLKRFETKKEARSWLEQNGFEQTGCEWRKPGAKLHHGEYNLPCYKIGKEENKYHIYVLYFFYWGTFGAPSSGPLSEDHAKQIEADYAELGN